LYNFCTFRSPDDFIPGRDLRIKILTIHLLPDVSAQAVPELHNLLLASNQANGVVNLGKFSNMSCDCFLALDAMAQMFPLLSAEIDRETKFKKNPRRTSPECKLLHHEQQLRYKSCMLYFPRSMTGRRPDS
jgi:hypothetical protein